MDADGRGPALGVDLLLVHQTLATARRVRRQASYEVRCEQSGQNTPEARAQRMDAYDASLVKTGRLDAEDAARRKAARTRDAAATAADTAEREHA